MSIRSILTVLSLSCALLLGGCRVYHMPIQQGNVLTLKRINSIHKGMTKQQVVSKIGSPAMVSPFQSNSLTYVYTLKPTEGASLYKRFDVTFKNGRVFSKQFTQH